MTATSPDSCQTALQQLKHHINSQIIGQEVLVERMLIALLADGHLLVEGAPGLAKTRAINVLSQAFRPIFTGCNLPRTCCRPI